MIIKVISNKRDAFGLQRAEAAGIDKLWLPYKRIPEDPVKAREQYCSELAKKVLEDQPDLVVCAGWMLILTPSFLGQLEAANVSIINLHPALPGK